MAPRLLDRRADVLAMPASSCDAAPDLLELLVGVARGEPLPPSGRRGSPRVAAVGAHVREVVAGDRVDGGMSVGVCRRAGHRPPRRTASWSDSHLSVVSADRRPPIAVAESTADGAGKPLSTPLEPSSAWRARLERRRELEQEGAQLAGPLERGEHHRSAALHVACSSAGVEPTRPRCGGAPTPSRKSGGSEPSVRRRRESSRWSFDLEGEARGRDLDPPGRRCPAPEPRRSSSSARRRRSARRTRGGDVRGHPGRKPLLDEPGSGRARCRRGCAADLRDGIVVPMEEIFPDPPLDGLPPCHRESMFSLIGGSEAAGPRSDAAAAGRRPGLRGGSVPPRSS